MPDSAEQITCRELVELVSDYLEGALAGDALMRFEQHLEPGAQGRVVPAHAIQERGPLGGGGLLFRQVEQGFFEALLVFDHLKACGSRSLRQPVRCFSGKTISHSETSSSVPRTTTNGRKPNAAARLARRS